MRGGGGKRRKGAAAARKSDLPSVSVSAFDVCMRDARCGEREWKSARIMRRSKPPRADRACRKFVSAVNAKQVTIIALHLIFASERAEIVMQRYREEHLFSVENVTFYISFYLTFQRI